LVHELTSGEQADQELGATCGKAGFRHGEGSATDEIVKPTGGWGPDGAGNRNCRGAGAIPNPLGIADEGVCLASCGL
jgi:hypothetical protein